MKGFKRCDEKTTDDQPKKRTKRTNKGSNLQKKALLTKCLASLLESKGGCFQRSAGNGKNGNCKGVRESFLDKFIELVKKADINPHTYSPHNRPG